MSGRRWAEALTWVAFASAAVALAYVLYAHVVLLTLPGPQDYREAGSILCTDALLRGKNAYAIRNQPVYANMYGIGYHLAAYPLASFAGSTFLLHRIISGGCVLAACALVGVTARRAGAAGDGVLLHQRRHRHGGGERDANDEPPVVATAALPHQPPRQHRAGDRGGDADRSGGVA